MPIDLEKLEDSDYLLDVLISAENVLDSLDAYAYRHWLEGEVIDGPIVRRHWVTFSLLYPYRKMPDPRAALRLLKHGVQVEFNSVKRQQAGKPGHLDSDPTHATDWLVKITIPRRLLDTLEEVDLEAYDDEVNPEDVTAAKDLGLDDESQYQTDEQLPNGQPPMPPEPGMPPNAPPPGPPNF
jgi:hypothetical protein